MGRRAMIPTMREATIKKNTVLSLVAGIFSVLLTTLASEAQPIGDWSAERLSATQQQLSLADNRIAKLSAEDAAKLTSFVVGNLFFVVVHELGHAVISQLKLPVLGREEDAADSFATLSMLLIGTELSHSVLRET